MTFLHAWTFETNQSDTAHTGGSACVLRTAWSAGPSPIRCSSRPLVTAIGVLSICAPPPQGL